MTAKRRPIRLGAYANTMLTIMALCLILLCANTAGFNWGRLILGDRWVRPLPVSVENRRPLCVSVENTVDVEVTNSR